MQLEENNCCQIAQSYSGTNVGNKSKPFVDSFYALGIPPSEGIDTTKFVQGKSCECLADCDQTSFVQVHNKTNFH